jgi:hypothetical protein
MKLWSGDFNSDLALFAAAGSRMPVTLAVSEQRCIIREEEYADFCVAAIGHRKGGLTCVGVERDTVNIYEHDPDGIVVVTWFLGLKKVPKGPKKRKK